MPEAIDKSFDNFVKLSEEIIKYKESICSEEDTRVKVIDRIFTEVLGWPYNEMLTEQKAGKGYLDYRFSVGGHARLIVEAKRDGKDFGLKARNEGVAYRLNGPVFKNDAVIEGINQAIAYCGIKNAELACVTNGREWIIFRGSRLGDGKDTLEEGVAFVFSSLEAIKAKFSLFFDLLYYENIKQYKFRVFFQEAEGQPIRAHVFCKALRNPESKTIVFSGDLAVDLDRIMISFFRQISGDDDKDLLKKCFIMTKESSSADKKLIRISEDLIGKIKNLETQKAEDLTEIIKRVKETQRNEFIIIIGHKGSGKSTFIDRFFAMILPEELKTECIIINVDLRKSPGDEKNIVSWLNENLLKKTEEALFKEAPPTYEELQGMFYDEYTRWRIGSQKFLYEKAKEEFKIEFGKHIEKIRTDNPHLYIRRLIGNIVKSRKKVPCIIFDNADHFSIEFQENVFQYARSIYENELCLIITPITDKTSWQLTRQGALQSFHSEVLHLPIPSPKKVMQKRIEYIEEKISKSKNSESGNYFFSRGIRLNIKNLKEFVACLQNVFLETGGVAHWLGNLSNYDIRRCLDLARDVMMSPYMQVSELYKAYILKTSLGIPEYIIKKAIILGKYDIYPVGQHTFVQNIYALNTEITTSPLLGLRVLQLLKDVQYKDIQGSQTYMHIDQIYDYFSAMSIEHRVVSFWLDAMLKTGLCLSYDPTIRDIAEAGKIEISPSGIQHLIWGLNDTTYMMSMLHITPLLDQDIFLSLEKLSKAKLKDSWKKLLAIFLDYLLKEDALYCNTPEHEAYDGQEKLLKKFKGTLKVFKT
jgi:energy-coupling factor transporter ATP-binding protein EcfA2